MPLVLAIEPDPRQAATLKRVVRGKVRADLVVVDSKDRALAEMSTRVPDLILVTALLPPRDENDLTEHLKALDGAAHLQTLTIPLFASAAAEEHGGNGRFGAFRRKRRAPQIDGCDPKMFGEQIEAYLQRAAELRAEAEAQARAQAELAAAMPAVEAPAVASEDFAQPAQPPADEWAASPTGAEQQACVFPEYVPTYVPPQPEYVESVDQEFAPHAVADQAMPLAEPEGAAIDEQTIGEMEAAPPIEAEPPASLEDVPQPVVQLDVAVEAEAGIAEPEPIVEPEIAAATIEPEIAAATVEPAVAAPIVEPEIVAAIEERDLTAETVEPEATALAAEPEAAVEVEPAPSSIEAETDGSVPQAETPAESAIPECGIANIEPEAGLVEPRVAIVEAERGAEIVESEPEAVTQVATPAADEQLVEVDLTEAVSTMAAEECAASDEETETEATPAAEKDTRVPPPPERHSPVHSAFARALGPLHAFAARVATGLRTASEHRARQVREAAATPTLEREHEPGRTAPEVQAVEAEPPAPAPETVSAATASEWDQALAAFDSRLKTDPSFSRPTDPSFARPTTPVESEPATATAHEEPPAAAPAEMPAAESVSSAAPVAARVVPTEEQPAAAAAEAAPPKERKRRRKRRSRPVAEVEPSITGLDGQFIATALAALRLDIERLRQDALGSAPPAESEADGEGEQFEADVAGNGGNGNGHGAASGNGNGNGHDAPIEPAPPHEPAEPVQDEWGFYDPGRCGIQALMARLDEQDAAAKQKSPDAKASAMSKLIASHDRSRAAAAHPPEPQPAAPAVIDTRLTPLSIWARVPDAPAFDIDQLLPLDAVTRPHDGSARARLAEQVAAVRYGSGCRIRRVRVAPPAKKPAKSAKRQVVILSKKALDELR